MAITNAVNEIHAKIQEQVQDSLFLVAVNIQSLLF